MDAVAPATSSPHLTAPTRRVRLALGICALLGLLVWGSLTWAAWLSAPQAARPAIPDAWGGLLFSPFDAPWPSAAPSVAPGSPAQPTAHGPQGVTGAAANLFAPACTSAGKHAIGSGVTVAADQWVCGDVNVYGGDVMVLGRVSGAVQVVNGSVTVVGEVDGAVTTLGGDIHIIGAGRVQGKAQAWGGQVYVANAANAYAGGGPGASSPQPFYSTVVTQLLAPDLGSLWLSLLFWTCASLGFAALLPHHLEQTRAMARRRPLISLFFGLLLAALAAIASVVLVVTCLGIPIALLLGLVIVIAWVVGTLALGAWVGERTLRLLGLRRHATILPATVLGTLLLAALKAIPYVGLAFGVVIGAMGLGAATLTLLSARRTTPPRSRRTPRLPVVPQIPQSLSVGPRQ